MTAVMPNRRFESDEMMARQLRGVSGRAPEPGLEDAEVTELVGDRERLVELSNALQRYFQITEGLPLPGFPPSHPSDRDSAAQAAFRREGDFWTVIFEGKTVRLRDIAGLRYLAALLANAGGEIAALEIARLEREGSDDDAFSAVDLGDGGPMLDRRAQTEYRRRLSDLRDQLDEAAMNGDLGRAAAAKEEIAFIEREISRALGLGGRDRRGGAAERARQSVNKAMKRALRRIGREHPELAAHLRRTVRTGTFCSYDPDPRARVSWAV